MNGSKDYLIVLNHKIKIHKKTNEAQSIIKLHNQIGKRLFLIVINNVKICFLAMTSFANSL